MENLIQETQLIGGFIVSLATILTALTVITQAFTQFNPLEPIRGWFNKPVTDRVCSLEHKVDKLAVAKMKSDIMNEGLPLSERIILAKEYLELGLNGDVSVKAKILLEDLEKRQREQGGK